uniref:Uncharacterized protein n=1 Tax=Oryza rufipogon TaxID=4529 RepID=A0A0E0QNZ9_ORYRU
MPTQTPPKLQLIKSSINYYYLPIRKKKKEIRKKSPMAKEKRILVEKKGGQNPELLAQLKRDSSGGEAIVLHGISASKHVATINSHSVCIVCLMLAPSIWCIPSHTIVLI